MIYANSEHDTFIRAYHGCYDLLAYPLFYPGGETGWEDKKVLLEENPVLRSPRVKRKHTKRIKLRLLWKCFNNFNSHSHYIMKLFYVCFVIHIMLVFLQMMLPARLM
jgi:hypothetical protein